jgi:hypothetical protein
MEPLTKQLQPETEIAKPALDIFPSYMAMIKNSVGSNLFRNRFFKINDVSIDVLDDGDLSCAMYVSSILLSLQLIKEPHTTVIGTIADIEEMGWYKITEPKEGALILWGFKKLDDGTQGKHNHVGFYIDAETAISNSSPDRHIVRHHLTYGHLDSGEPRRDILAYYWHPKLDA